MSIYDMIDKFACEVRHYLDTHDVSADEQEVGESIYNQLVAHTTYFDEGASN